MLSAVIECQGLQPETINTAKYYYRIANAYTQSHWGTNHQQSNCGQRHKCKDSVTADMLSDVIECQGLQPETRNTAKYYYRITNAYTKSHWGANHQQSNCGQRH